MRETVELIVKSLVDEADAVEVLALERGGVTRLEVRVAEGDMGKLIGRQGRTIRALRAVVHAASLKRNQRFVLEVME